VRRTEVSARAIERASSDPTAERPTNKAGQPAEEPEERRAETEGNAVQQSTRRAQNRESVSQALDRIRQAARQRRKEKFTALLHHISPEHLEAAFFELKENAAPGVDGLTWRAYEEGLDAKILDLHSRLHKGAYRALPSRRIYIPKPDGRQRPLAVAALEDKIVQRATIGVLNAIYEKTSSGSRTDSDRSAASMMRWTPWSSESPSGK
jgi:RNA-directed DNA polymerase